MTKEQIEKYKIFECISGSYAYGLNTEDSDIDTRSVFCLSLNELLNPITKTQQVNDSTNDIQCYGFDKFFKLQIDQNPNIIELLWIPEKWIKFETEFWKEYKSQRHLLLSKKCYHTFSGYAYGQLKKIKGHNKWIYNPQPKDSPKHYQYIKLLDLKTGEELKHDEMNIHILNRCGAKKISEEFFILYSNGFGIFDKLGFFKSNHSGEFDKSFPLCFMQFHRQQFEQDYKIWENYWKWKLSRNVKRAELEEKYGYDTKHASHLIRLLLMCNLILKEHIVYVELPEELRNLVKDIKTGKYNYEQIIDISTTLEEENKSLYTTSSLRKKININRAIDFYTKLVLKYRN